MSLARDVENLRREVEMLRRVVCKLPLRQPHGGHGGPAVTLYPSYADMEGKGFTGDLGLTADLGNLYFHDSDGWRVMHPFRQSTAPSGIGESDGDGWYDTDNDAYYRYIQGNWRLDSHWASP